MVAADNNVKILDLETEIDGAVLGDACYKVTWDAKRERVRITSPDVQGLHAWWEPDDPNQVTQVAHQYRIPRDSAPSVSSVVNQGRGGREVTITERWTQDQFDLWTDDQLTITGPNPTPGSLTSCCTTSAGPRPSGAPQTWRPSTTPRRS